MKTEQIINPKLVGEITTLIQAGTAANRRIREMFHGWEQLHALAGLERGFYCQVGQVAQAAGENFGCDEWCALDKLGMAAYQAYMAGATQIAMDQI